MVVGEDRPLPKEPAACRSGHRGAEPAQRRLSILLEADRRWSLRIDHEKPQGLNRKASPKRPCFPLALLLAARDSPCWPCGFVPWQLASGNTVVRGLKGYAMCWDARRFWTQDVVRVSMTYAGRRNTCTARGACESPPRTRRNWTESGKPKAESRARRPLQYVCALASCTLHCEFANCANIGGSRLAL